MKRSTVSSAHCDTRLTLFGAMLALCSIVFPSVAAADSFQAVGALSEARWEAPLVALADGTALVIGGWKEGDEQVGLPSAERFDPKTNQFTTAGRMRQGRMGHAVARLRDGRVLVVAGVTALGGGPGATLLDAEIFDPAMGSFATVGKISMLRGSPTATLLPNGEVLVAGGWTSDAIGPTPTAELFDPVSGQFRKTGLMAAARYRHAALSLLDGRVVLLGGYGRGNAPVKRVEIYDPRTGEFGPAGELVEGRGDLSADLLADGRILVVGGRGKVSGKDAIFDSLEIYDPATGKASVAARLPEPIIGHVQSVLPDGRVLLAGGLRTLDPDAATPADQLPARLFDPRTGEITLAAPMAQLRDTASGVRLPDGRVVIAGGWGYDSVRKEWIVLATAEVYVP